RRAVERHIALPALGDSGERAGAATASSRWPRVYPRRIRRRDLVGVILVAVGGGMVIVATFLPWVSVRTSVLEAPLHGPARVREYSGWQLAHRCHAGPRFVDDVYFSSLPAVCSVHVEEDTQPVPTGVWTLALGAGLLVVASLLAIATRSSPTRARPTPLPVHLVAGVLPGAFPPPLLGLSTHPLTM